MSDVFGGSVGPAGLAWLAAAAAAAGLVRGFTGFGSALVFMPMAALFVPPIWAIIVLVVMDFIGPLPLLPRALREGRPREVARMAAGAAVGVPMGLALLSVLPVVAFRWAVSAVALAVLTLLVMGWRYRGRVTATLTAAVGWVSGFLGGSTGLGGPPVVFLNMASRRPAQTIRANMVLFIVCTDTLLLITLAVSGGLELAAVTLGIALTAPFFLAATLGGAIFRPERERLYRGFAYVLVAVAAVAGLPVW